MTEGCSSESSISQLSSLEEKAESESGGGERVFAQSCHFLSWDRVALWTGGLKKSGVLGLREGEEKGCASLAQSSKV